MDFSPLVTLVYLSVSEPLINIREFFHEPKSIRLFFHMLQT